MRAEKSVGCGFFVRKHPCEEEEEEKENKKDEDEDEEEEKAEARKGRQSRSKKKKETKVIQKVQQKCMLVWFHNFSEEEEEKENKKEEEEEEEDEDELEEKSFEKAFKVVPRFYGKTNSTRNFSNFHFNHSEPLAGTHQVCRPPKPIFLNGGKP